MRKTLFPIIASLALAAATSSALAQDAKAGEKKAAMCIGCHGIPAYQASFPEVHKVPMIAGQGSKYIVSALTAYQKGDRKHPTMRAIAASLTPQDMADLAAYYEALPKDEQPLPPKPEHQPPAPVAELLKKANCAACHGDNFSKPIDQATPKLAGQHADYLYVALKAYQTQGNPQVGRANPVMGGMVGNLTRAEMKQIAQYIGSLPSELRTVQQSRFR
jgi:cytochrome c553